MFIQRIMLDSEFIDNAIREVEPVITLGILPELVARWFTRSKIPIHASNSHSSPVIQSDEGNAGYPKGDASTSSANEDTTSNEGNVGNPKGDASTSSANEDTTSNEGNVGNPKGDASTSSANEDTTVDVDHENDVDSTTPNHLPIRSCDGNSTYPQCNDNSSVNVHSSDADSDGNQKVWCYCSRDDVYDNLIGCDNTECKIQWFHLSCVNLNQDQVPDGDWYCFDCRK